MSDLISKRFIQEALIERISNLNAEGEKSIQTARELIRFKRFVDGLTPSAERPTEWIPCSKKKPKAHKHVLYLYKADDEGHYCVESDFAASELNNIAVAWMPFIEYKGCDEE